MRLQKTQFALLALAALLIAGSVTGSLAAHGKSTQPAASEVTQAGATIRESGSGAGAEQVYEGMVTCSRCGAKHSPDMAQAADRCVRVCVHDGAKFALETVDSSYILEGDLNILKKLSGQRARIVGTLDGKTLKFSSASAS